MKPKNRTAWTCPICGKQFTNAGRIGHMRWKHGKDHAAPLISVAKPYPVGEARRKASLYDGITADFVRMHEEERTLANIKALHRRLRQVSEHKQGEAYMAESVPLVKEYMAKHNLTEAELYDQLAEEKRCFEKILELVTSLSLSGRRKRQP